MRKKIIYGLTIVLVLAGLSMFHGGLRSKIIGNLRYQSAIRELDPYELQADDDNLAAFNGQISELLKIPREIGYSGVKHKLRGELVVGNKSYAATFNPLGMYADHWKEKPSIRVNILDETLKNGISEFSFLRPVTRDFLGDWIAGILSEEQGLINLYRQPVALDFDDKGRRTFLMEETFRGYTKRHEKKGFAFKYCIENDSCSIKPYCKSVPKALIARLEENISGVLIDPERADEFFATEKMAKYYAITDLVQGFHQLVELNTHFFYDVESGLMEPIGREWNTANYASEDKTCSSAYVEVENPVFLPSQLHVCLLKNEKIRKQYQEAKTAWTPESLHATLTKIEDQKQTYVCAMWKDLGRRTYSFEYVLENLKFIQSISADE